MSDSVRPHRRKPTRLPWPWDSPGKNTGVGCHCLLRALICAAKLLQSCPTLCDPIDGSPPGSPGLGILQARILEWVAISFSNAWKWKVKGKLLSCVRLLVTPWTVAYQAPPSLGFSRQEYWSGVPLPSPNLNIISHYLIIIILFWEIGSCIIFCHNFWSMSFSHVRFELFWIDLLQNSLYIIRIIILSCIPNIFFQFMFWVVHGTVSM